MPQNNVDGKIRDSLADLEITQPVAPEQPQAAKVEAREAGFEIKPEQPEVRPDQIKEEAPAASQFSQAFKAAAAPAAKSQLNLQVEGILAEGLGETYAKMPAAVKREFKEKGEETAFKISRLLSSAKVKVKEIFILILRWLRIIPGVNKFFLEQEAKIKADRLLALKERMEK